MAHKLYMDHHIPRAITDGLRRRGVDVLTAAEDAANRLADPVLLNRASELGRVLFTQDQDFLSDAHERQRAGRPFGGIIYARQRITTIGEYIADLELLILASSAEELANTVTYLPL